MSAARPKRRDNGCTCSRNTRKSATSRRRRSQARRASLKPGAAALDYPEARRHPPALRLPAGVRRRPQVLADSEGPLARPQGQAARRDGGRPPAGLRLVRRRDPEGRVRRRPGDRLGRRDVLAGRGRRLLLGRPRRSRPPDAGGPREESSRSTCRGTSSRARSRWSSWRRARPAKSGSSSSTRTVSPIPIATSSKKIAPSSPA